MAVFLGTALFLVLAATVHGLPSGNEEEISNHIEKRIIGGEFITSQTQWPWLVYLKAGGSDFNSRHCGGSLVNERWVLTAAHCFDNGRVYSDATNWYAQMGETVRNRQVVDNVNTQRNSTNGLVLYYIRGEKLIVHPGYDASRNWLNDIALLKLSRPVPAGPIVVPRIQSVRLAKFIDRNFPPENTECVMKGWGCAEEGGPLVNLAKEIRLPKVSNRACTATYGVSNTRRFCAGSYLKSMGICQGDSGGPLVCWRDGQWTQVGIASFGTVDRPGNFPAVFTRVSYYERWISDTIRLN